MNSTVSHEMRNPLNAIISHIDKQKECLQQLTDIKHDLHLNHSLDARLCEIIQLFTSSLDVSQSSCNLIKFNVEDILALP